MPMVPLRTENIKGVHPWLFWSLTPTPFFAAHCSMAHRVTATFSLWIEMKMIFHPSEFFRVTSAPSLTSSLATFKWPFVKACIKGVDKYSPLL